MTFSGLLALLTLVLVIVGYVQGTIPTIIAVCLGLLSVAILVGVYYPTRWWTRTQ